MLKKIGIIILIIVILLGGIAAYFYFFKKPAAETAGGGFSLQDLFPFIDNGGTTETPENTPVTLPPKENSPEEATTPPKLRLITKGPIAGATIYDATRLKEVDPNAPKKYINGKPAPAETEVKAYVRFTERSNGHTSEMFLDADAPETITNTTIPKIYESLFAQNGKIVLLRYADPDMTIQTFGGIIPDKLPPQQTVTSTPAASTSTGGVATGNTTTPTPAPVLLQSFDLKGSYLSQNILSLAVSPDTQKIFTITPFDGGVVGTVSLPDGTKKSQILSIAYSEWLPEWPNIKMITLTTKPSSKVAGYFYSLDPDKKIMKKIFGGVLGLTTNTSPDGKNILFSSSNNGQLSTSLYSTTSKEVVSLPGVTTLPEKCVWQSISILYCAVPTYMKNAEYPDEWYQGAVSFSDQIYKIDISNFKTTIIANPSDIQTSIDAINLRVDTNNTYLIFTNKKDGSLWSLDLTPETPPATETNTQ